MIAIRPPSLRFASVCTLVSRRSRSPVVSGAVMAATLVMGVGWTPVAAQDERVTPQDQLPTRALEIEAARRAKAEALEERDGRQRDPEPQVFTEKRAMTG